MVTNERATFEPGWLQALHARADLPPVAPRRALYVAGSDAPIGSVEATLGQRLAEAGMLRATASGGWEIGEQGAPLDLAFARIAAWLRDTGLASAWRDELLDVADAAGRRVAATERAAVRPLGIATHAVHLVGYAEHGGVWVQQRAFDKATDPGQWDTLVGGLVASDESVATTLARETWEEAGLRVGELRDVVAVDRLAVKRPVAEGYMVEHIHVFEATVPARLVPLNQDGEVAAFACLREADLRARLAGGAFTLEAALILAASLRRHGVAL